jgi:hypothetical protein
MVVIIVICERDAHCHTDQAAQQGILGICLRGAGGHQTCR